MTFEPEMLESRSKAQKTWTRAKIPMKTSTNYFGLVVGPGPGKMSEDCPKTTSLMTSLTKICNPQPKFFFWVQSRRLANWLEPFNSTLVQSAEELGRW